MLIDELERKWNEQADRYNQWVHLGLDEKLEFAVAEERERCARLCDPANADRPDDWTEYAKVRAECAARIRNFGKEKEK